MRLSPSSNIKIFFLNLDNECIMMTTMKNLIKSAIEKLGYSIVKIHKPMVVSDKLVKVKIGKFSILLGENHRLPVFLKHQKYYSLNLPRIAQAVFGKYSDIKIIDIGANVGDTVALVRNACTVPMLCIEGDADFFKTLVENIKQFKGVEAYRQLLGDKDRSINAQLKSDGETAELAHSGNTGGNDSLSIVKLDTFLEGHSAFKKSKLVKIDTDGYDVKIIRGAERFIKESKPVLFFEYDPMMLENNGDDGLAMFAMLNTLGYKDVLFYDNLGKLILSTEVSNTLLLRQMHEYIDKKARAPFPYYDIAVFHSEDADLASDFIKKEMKFYYGN